MHPMHFLFSYFLSYYLYRICVAVLNIIYVRNVYVCWQLYFISNANDKSECLQGLTLFLSYAILAAVLGMLQFGYNTGVINAPEVVRLST